MADANTKRLLAKLNNKKISIEFQRRYKTKIAKLPPKSRLIMYPLPRWPYDKRLELWLCKWFRCRLKLPRYRVRKNQKNLTKDEWERFKGAINAIMQSGISPPSYQEFVDVHVQAMMTATGRSWGVHTMAPTSSLPADDGRNFLAWHREYLMHFEDRLRAFNPLVTIPYWNWAEDRAIPAELSVPQDLTRWGVTRAPSFLEPLPTQTQVDNVMANTTWSGFTSNLEGGPHNTVHRAVGGTMRTAGSPGDPLFWLHHAMVDKLWADWQKINTAKQTNLTETLQPPPLITRTVSQVQSTFSLGYVYV